MQTLHKFSNQTNVTERCIEIPYCFCWSCRFASLEGELALLQNELNSAAAEKVQFEERMVCVREDAAVKTKELEDEVNQLKVKLCSADEQERMLTDIIEQKLELEETIEILKAENVQNKEFSEEKCSIEARFEQFKVEKETEIENLMAELTRLQQQLKERSNGVEEKDALLAQFVEQKRGEQGAFDLFKADKENELSEFNEQIEKLRAELKEKTSCIGEKEAMLTEVEQRKCETEKELEEVKASKESEVATLNQELEQIRTEIQEKLCSLEEKESMLTEVIQQKCFLEERFEEFKEEKEREASQMIKEVEKLQLETQNREDAANGTTSLLDEISQEKCAVEEQLNAFREEKEQQITKLTEDIEVLKSKLNEKELSLEEKESLLSETIRQKSELADNFKMDKESELQKLNDRMKELEVQLQERTSMVEEKENLLNEMIQLKCEAEEKLKINGQEKEKEVEMLMQQLKNSEALKDDFNKSLDAEDKQVMLLTAKVVK